MCFPLPCPSHIAKCLMNRRRVLESEIGAIRPILPGENILLIGQIKRADFVSTVHPIEIYHRKEDFKIKCVLGLLCTG